MPGSRQRPYLKPAVYISMMISLVSVYLVGAYVYSPKSSLLCYIFSSGCLNGAFEQHRPTAQRELTDEETAARVVIKEILKRPLAQSKNPKIAFMFLTPGPLPFEKLWHKFFAVRLLFSILDLECFFFFVQFVLEMIFISLSMFEMISTAPLVSLTLLTSMLNQSLSFRVMTTDFLYMCMHLETNQHTWAPIL